MTRKPTTISGTLRGSLLYLTAILASYLLGWGCGELLMSIIPPSAAGFAFGLAVVIPFIFIFTNFIYIPGIIPSSKINLYLIWAIISVPMYIAYWMVLAVLYASKYGW